MIFWDESIDNKIADGDHIFKKSNEVSPNLKEVFGETYFNILNNF